MIPAARASASLYDDRRRHVVQGEQAVSRDPEVMLTTLLGSCVAACLYDPVAEVGGMNHFLLPGEAEAAGGLRQGVHAMELLVNALLKEGALRQRLRAKVFGGASMVERLTDVGQRNAAFAEAFLRREGIEVAGADLRGEQGRRVQFWPVGGRARQMLMAPNDRSAFELERRRPRRIAPATGDGELELF